MSQNVYPPHKYDELFDVFHKDPTVSELENLSESHHKRIQSSQILARVAHPVVVDHLKSDSLDIDAKVFEFELEILKKPIDL